MTTPVSAATPTSAINPTATATDKLNPSHHISHRPPTNEKGTESMMIRVSVTRRKFRYNSTKTMRIVNGTTTSRRALARSKYSNWPLHVT